jgi:hypothetical protein
MTKKNEHKRLIPARNYHTNKGDYSDEHGLDPSNMSCSYDEYPIDQEILEQALASNRSNAWQEELYRGTRFQRKARSGRPSKIVMNRF